MTAIGTGMKFNLYPPKVRERLADANIPKSAGKAVDAEPGTVVQLSPEAHRAYARHVAQSAKQPASSGGDLPAVTVEKPQPPVGATPPSDQPTYPTLMPTDPTSSGSLRSSMPSDPIVPILSSSSVVLPQ